MSYPSYLLHYSDELYHYGIKGQKWGERQYQYEDGTYTELGKERRRIGPHDYGNKKYEIKKKLYGSSDKTKVNNNFSKNISIDEDLTKKQKETIESISKDAIAVNGNSGTNTKASSRTNNCPFCAMTYELRRRGEDVQAQETITGLKALEEDGAYYDSIVNYNKVIKNTRKYADVRSEAEEYLKEIHKKPGDRISANQMIEYARILDQKISREEYGTLKKELLSDGKNSRGFIDFRWSGIDGGGHIINYEVVDGKLLFIDSQTGKIMDADNAYKEYFKYANTLRTLRTDNVKLNTDVAKKKFSEPTSNEIKDYKTLSSDEKLTKRMIGKALGGVAGFVLGTAAEVAIAYHYDIEPTGIGPAIGSLLGAAVGIGITEASIDSIEAEDRQNTKEIQKKWKEENRLDWYNFTDEEKKEIKKEIKKK